MTVADQDLLNLVLHQNLLLLSNIKIICTATPSEIIENIFDENFYSYINRILSKTITSSDWELVNPSITDEFKTDERYTFYSQNPILDQKTNKNVYTKSIEVFTRHKKCNFLVSNKILDFKIFVLDKKIVYDYITYFLQKLERSSDSNNFIVNFMDTLIALFLYTKNPNTKLYAIIFTAFSNLYKNISPKTNSLILYYSLKHVNVSLLSNSVLEIFVQLDDRYKNLIKEKYDAFFTHTENIISNMMKEITRDPTTLLSEHKYPYLPVGFLNTISDIC